MTQILKLAALALSVLTFFGYAFLSNYYERFGIRLQDIPLDSSHIFLRLVSLLFLHPTILIVMVLIGLAVWSCFLPIRLQLAGKSIKPAVLAVPLLIVTALGSFLFLRNLAIYYANRDIDGRTSALRQLICVNSGVQSVDKWVQAQGDNSRKILILQNRTEKIIAFLAPLQPDLPSPSVTVFELGIGKNAVVAHSVSTISVSNDFRTNGCKL